MRPFSSGKFQQNISSHVNLLCERCNEGRKCLYICLSKQASWSMLKCSSAAACLAPPITTLHSDLKYMFIPLDYKSAEQYILFHLPEFTSVMKYWYKRCYTETCSINYKIPSKNKNTHLSIWGNTVQQEYDWGAGDTREWGRLLGCTVSFHPEGK